MARLIGEKLAQRLGQPVIVDNRTGAGGILGTDAVAKAAPDGYTLLFSLGTSLLNNQFLYKKLPYDTLRDFALISRIADAPLVLAVHPRLGVKSVPELLAYIKQGKEDLSYGSYGTGSVSHLNGAYLNKSQGANMVHVAYKGEAAMIQDLIGGQIQIAFGSAQNLKPHFESGRLQVVAVTGAHRLEALPSVPTMDEQGFKEDAYRIVGFMGMAAPAKTPNAIVQRVAKEVTAICAQPDVQGRIVAMGFRVTAGSPEAFAASYKRDAPIWEALVKGSGAQLD